MLVQKARTDLVPPADEQVRETCWFTASFYPSLYHPQRIAQALAAPLAREPMSKGSTQTDDPTTSYIEAGTSTDKLTTRSYADAATSTTQDELLKPHVHMQAAPKNKQPTDTKDKGRETGNTAQQVQSDFTHVYTDRRAMITPAPAAPSTPDTPPPPPQGPPAHPRTIVLHRVTTRHRSGQIRHWIAEDNKHITVLGIR